ncbi:MAG: hypothetical protein U5N56_07910 [Candidatus Marinimicrobia bacterium]|nr:hypothetical protein [Candidatus Neomarinimicrobiota bacterium]
MKKTRFIFLMIFGVLFSSEAEISQMIILLTDMIYPLAAALLASIITLGFTLGKRYQK